MGTDRLTNYSVAIWSVTLLMVRVLINYDLVDTIYMIAI